MQAADAAAEELPLLAKSPTGIDGFDEITLGGLPRGRTSLVCGGPGCGKTLFGLHFLINGIREFGEPGAFIAFEETPEDLVQNVASLGVDLQRLIEEGRISIDHVHVERNEIAEAGDYNLDGLFVRLKLAIDSVGAKRVVIDTLEALFGGLDNHAILRAELRRMFLWLKEQGVTTIITGERGDGELTRHGLEEYVSDCVILLDHRVRHQVSTRRLQVVKYRGSSHGTNEYPFLIDADGIAVMPITSVGLDHDASDERVGTGIPRLDEMLGGGGYYRGSTVLVTGTAGAGKSSMAAHFADATCRRGERCLYFSFEESPGQIRRNMASVGLDLAAHEQAGLLRFHAARPTMSGLETHLAVMHKMVNDYEPSAVIVDPCGSIIAGGNEHEANQMVIRLIDFLKSRGITALMTSLTHGSAALEATDIAVSSIVDTWLLVKMIEVSGERNRALYLLKSRGMAHSHQVREFVITDHGIDLVDVYVGPEGVLTGSARLQQEHRERAQKTQRKREVERRQRELEQKRRALEHQVKLLQAQFETEATEIERFIAESEASEDVLHDQQRQLADRRGASRQELDAVDGGTQS